MPDAHLDSWVNAFRQDEQHGGERSNGVIIRAGGPFPHPQDEASARPFQSGAGSGSKTGHPRPRRLARASRPFHALVRGSPSAFSNRRFSQIFTSALTPAIGSKRGRFGAVKEAILELVKNAGSKGITVKDIAAKLKTKPQLVHVWFGSAGKNVKEIKKVGAGEYGWAG